MADKKADTAAVDRGENTGLMEPLLLGESSRHRPALTDLAFDLTQIPLWPSPQPAPELGNLARRIGPGDELLLLQSNRRPRHSPIRHLNDGPKNDYSQDRKKRDLQLEAKAHIAVQEWIDGGGSKGVQALTMAGIGNCT